MNAAINKGCTALLLALGLASTASPQYWEDAGQPTSAVAARVCYTDTVHDVLIVSTASPLIANYYYPLFSYNGEQWDTLGLFGNIVNTAVVYHDTLIVGGAFLHIEGEPIKRIACHVDGTWQPYGDFNSGIDAAHVRTLRVLDGELYALGVFENADGQFCNGVAKRVGGHWESLPDLPTNFLGDPWFYDIARFQGRLVVSGNFHTTDGTLFDMMQYDGTSWQSVCDGCMHGGMDGAGNLVVYKDQLYMGGVSHYGSGNPGQGIMRWDGEQWYGLGPVGGGLQTINYSDQYSPVVDMIKVHDGLLFFCGSLSFVNHMATPGIASWDGTDFCSLGGAGLTTSTSAFDIYHDTLYISIGPNGAIGRGLLRYLSTDLTEQCSTLGVEEAQGARGENFQVAWSPSGAFTLLGLSDGPHELRLYDPQGRLVLRQRVRSQGGRSEAVPFSEPGMALYLVVMDAQLTGRLVPVR